MDPLIGSSIIEGVGALGGAALGGKAAKSAAKTQAATTDKALAFTREQEAQRKAVYDQKMQQWTASRNALLKRYGIDIAPPTPDAPPAGPQAQPRPVMNQPGPMPGAAPGGNLAALIQQRQVPPDLEGWNRPSYGIPQV